MPLHGLPSLQFASTVQGEPIWHPLAASQCWLAGQSALFATVTQPMVVSLQLETSHATAGVAHTTGVPEMHPVPGAGAVGLHVSMPVQNSPSEQAALFGVCTHPSVTVGSQESTVQLSPSSHESIVP